ncbi:hypothetical protein POM88_002062 [Heracleum sosnowskyi]|uniref:Uncharacterized protein n=1 Tax=Heracleum sosnowskyi TaxID=360622 RepID=A0AAD8JDQ6_9APIA|nr:hypothetical protein POM88_002062 [Heracleum sosnowskyi]
MKANKSSDVSEDSASYDPSLNLVKSFSHDQRPVALWSKNWIIGRWIALVFLFFFVLVVDIHCFRLLRKYNPEDTVHGLFVMGFGNLVGFGFLATQARELIEDSNTVDNLPWWCFGLTTSRSK